MGKSIDIWSRDIASGYRSPEDPELVTIAWSVNKGVFIESVEVLEGSLMILKVRVPLAMQDDTDSGDPS